MAFLNIWHSRVSTRFWIRCNGQGLLSSATNEVDRKENQESFLFVWNIVLILMLTLYTPEFKFNFKPLS